MLRTLRAAFAALALLLPVAASASAESCIWISSNDALSQLRANSNVIALTVPLERATALAMNGQDCGVWAVGQKQLLQYDANGALQRRIDLDAIDKKLAGAVQLVVDAYDGSIWIADHKKLVHLSSVGSVISESLVTGPVRSIVVALDQSVWVLGNKQLWHFSAQGALLSSLALHQLVTDAPNSLVVDSVRGILWLAGPENIVQIKLSQLDQVAHRIAVPEAMAGMALDPLTSRLWVAGQGSLQAYDTEAQLVRSVSLADAGLTHAQSIAFDPAAKVLWVASREAVARYSSDGVLQATFPVRQSGGLIAVPAFAVDPVITLIQPPQDALTNNAQREVAIGYDAWCNGQPCGFAPGYFAGYRLSASINAQPIGSLFVFDPATAQMRYVPATRHAEGRNDLAAQATDANGRQSNALTAHFTVDTIPPVVTVTSPQSGLLTNQPAQTIQGAVSEPASLLVNAQVAQMGGDGSFSHPVTLQEELNKITVVAIDGASNAGQAQIEIALDTIPPAAPNGALIEAAAPVNGQTTVTGKAGAVEASSSVTITNGKTKQTVTISAGADGGFVVQLAASGGDVLSIIAMDKTGNQSTITTVKVAGTGHDGDDAIPPDPASVATPINPTVPTGIASSTAFLYSGPNAIQTGVAPGVIEARRVAVLRGKVISRDNEPLPGVNITVLGHPEFGKTLSRADGMFDMAVNGGEVLTVVYEKNGYLLAQRQVQAPWKDFAWAPDVVLVGLDPQVTRISLATGTPQVAQGSSVTDSDGTRQATILFPVNTTASMVMRDGSKRSIDTLHVRATEYTVGPNGPKAMPGALPSSTAYTYAVEFSVDEAIAAGAKEVVFSQPLPVYVDNFLHFPEGTVVPVGYYDQDKGKWVASKNGRVIKILSVTSGLADLDVDGTGTVANSLALARLKITEAERRQLVALYAPGKSLWRVPVSHFTPYDFNWAIHFLGETGNREPTGCDDDGNCTGPEDEKDLDPCTASGSIIECQNQVLGERIAIVGTPFNLNYRSDRVPGYRASSVLKIPLSKSELPSGLTEIKLEVEIAGQRFERIFPPRPNQIYTFEWNGKDAYGRAMVGKQVANVRIGYIYKTLYAFPPPDFDYQSELLAWNFPGVVLSNIEGRTNFEVWRKFSKTLIRPQIGNMQGIGGWTLDVNHIYNREHETLLRGDGTVRAMQTINVDAYAQLVYPASTAIPHTAIDPEGNVLVSGGWIGFGLSKISVDGTSSRLTSAYGDSVFSVASYGKDIYFGLAYYQARNIVKLAPDGTRTRVAGMEFELEGDNEGPALSVVVRPVAMVADQEGNIYFSEQEAVSGYYWLHRCYVKKLSTDGYVSIVAGNGSCREGRGDGGPATSAGLYRPSSLAVDSQGNLYIADEYTVRKVTRDGKIHKVAGDGTSSFPPDGNIGDGGPATEAHLGSKTGSYRIHSIAIDKSDNLLIASRDRIRQVSSNGIITTIAGSDLAICDRSQIGGPALAFCPAWFQAMAVDNENNIIIFDGQTEPVLRKIGMKQRATTQLESFMPSDDGSQLYVFDEDGRHKRTQDAKLNATLYQFSYDNYGWLSQVQDGAGNVTRIERDSDGKPTAVIAPDGQRTTLRLDANGYLESVTNPANQSYRMVNTAAGLLIKFTNPKDYTSSMSYDDSGRLERDQNAGDGYWSLARTSKGYGDYEVAMTSAMGRTKRFENRTSSATKIRRVIDASGRQSESIDSGKGSIKSTSANGTVTTAVQGPDPRFAMLAPIEKQLTIAVPSGLTFQKSLGRAVTLGMGELLNLQTQTDITTINGKVFTTVYHAGQRQYTSTTPLNRQTILKTDALSRPIFMQTAGVEPVHSTYDPRGRLSFTTQGIGPVERKVSFAYNAEGWVHSVTDPLLRKTEYRYDLTGRVTKVILPDLREIGYSYDPNGNVTSITPPSRPIHGFGYNEVDLETGYQPPDFGAGPKPTEYRYNLDKQITQVIRPDGQQSLFDYDSGGRLSTITAPHGVTTYSYTPTTGTLAGITAPGGVELSYTYDGALPLTETLTGPVIGTVAMAYNSDFNIRALTIGGVEFAYRYDGDGLLNGVGAMSISRDVGNGVITGTQLGGIATAQSYNAFGEMKDFSASQGGAALFAQSYKRDKLGRIEQKVETVAGQTDGYGYEYNDVGRLVKVTKNGTVIASYQYDDNGNRTSDGQNSAAYDAQDRLTQYGSISFTYTDNGELKTRSADGQTVQYEYDVSGNLRTAGLPDGTNVDYIIDGRNRRIGKKVNGALVQGFLFQDQLNPVAELSGTGSIVARFIYGTKAHVPDYMVRGGITYRIVSDHLGSVRMVVDTASGNIVQRMDYDAYGYVIQDTNPGFQPFGFAGGIYDQNTKLTRFGARDYDAEAGRWTAKDPIRFDGGDTNLYGYVLNDPVNFLDPNGEAIHIAIGAAIGGISAAVGAMRNKCATGGDILRATAAGALVGGVTALVPIRGSLIAAVVRNAAAGAGGNAVGQTLTGGLGNVNIGQVATQGAIGGLAGGAGNVVGLNQSLGALAAGATAQQAIAVGSGVGTTAAIGASAVANSQVSPSLGGYGRAGSAECECK